MSSTDPQYDEQFFNTIGPGSESSAQVVVPLVAGWVQPKRVIDVGCGTGAWLATFRDYGAECILGIDGAAVPASAMLIPPGTFLSRNLTAPLHLSETFDLAMCLEVAEHLPARCASDLVAGLVRLAPVVLFSAATPGQGGCGHINEQWAEYWEALFAQHRYLRLDCLRWRLWNDNRVKWWYKQNLFIYVSERRLDRDPILKGLHASESTERMTLVRSETLTNYLIAITNIRLALRRAPRQLWAALLRRVVINHPKSTSE